MPTTHTIPTASVARLITETPWLPLKGAVGLLEAVTLDGGRATGFMLAPLPGRDTTELYWDHDVEEVSVPVGSVVVAHGVADVITIPGSRRTRTDLVSAKIHLVTRQGWRRLYDEQRVTRDIDRGRTLILDWLQTPASREFVRGEAAGQARAA